MTALRYHSAWSLQSGQTGRASRFTNRSTATRLSCGFLRARASHATATSQAHGQNRVPFASNGLDFAFLLSIASLARLSRATPTTSSSAPACWEAGIFTLVGYYHTEVPAAVSPDRNLVSGYEKKIFCASLNFCLFRYAPPDGCIMGSIWKSSRKKKEGAATHRISAERLLEVRRSLLTFYRRTDGRECILGRDEPARKMGPRVRATASLGHREASLL